MACVASLLDDEHSALVAALWDQFEREFGLRGASRAPYPHVTYHAAESYDLEALSGAIGVAAAESEPFQIETTGIGIFTGHRPVLYVALIRDAPIDALHGCLWQALEGLSTGVESFLNPRLWVPHITLGLDDLNDEALAKVTRVLAHREFRWKIRVDNLTVMDEVEGTSCPVARFALGGPRV